METSEQFAQLRDLDFDIPGVPGASPDSLPYRKYELIVWEGISVLQSEANVHGGILAS
jgi:hypothetical protein